MRGFVNASLRMEIERHDKACELVSSLGLAAGARAFAPVGPDQFRRRRANILEEDFA